MDAKIKTLVAAHFVVFLVGWIGAFHHAPDVRFGFFLGVIFSEVGLLGIWAALGHAPWARRLLAAAAVIVASCVATLVAEPYAELPQAVGYLLVFGLPCAIVFCVLGVLRRSGRRLALRRATEFSAREGFQFSIKHLLIATALVAGAVSVGKVTRTWHPNDRWLDMLPVLAVIPPCFVFVALATLWATLGLGRPLPRLSFVSPGALMAGLMPLVCLPGDPNMKDFLLWLAMTGTTLLITVGSLLVVRSAGWRLCSAAKEKEACELRGESLRSPLPPGEG